MDAAMWSQRWAGEARSIVFFRSMRRTDKGMFIQLMHIDNCSLQFLNIVYVRKSIVAKCSALFSIH